MSSSRFHTAVERLRVFAKAFRCPPGGSVEQAKLDLSSANQGALVQAVRAGSGENPTLFGMLAAQTLLADSSGSKLARKTEIDFLLRVAGTTQIAEAIKKSGTREGDAFVVVVAGAKEPTVPHGFPGEELPERRLSRAELQKVERAALLSVEKP